MSRICAPAFCGSWEEQRDYRNRQAMVERVKNSWIKGVLEQSLYQVARAELNLQEQSDAVERPRAAVVQEQGRLTRELSHGVRMSDLFDELGGGLLILGAPGTGKTTMLLELASDLLDRAARDPEHPIPVVFHLSSWAVRRQPLDAWMVDELKERYDVPQKVARTWVEQEAILPLLDGLDEVTEEHRAACAEAINAWRREHGLVPMAVCSRMAEYETLAVRLRLQRAVAIEPLAREQVDAYLEGARPALAGVQQSLSVDATLYELLDTPLMLGIVGLAYSGDPAAGLQMAGTIEERQERLFGAYVETMLKRRGEEGRYVRHQVGRWLAWLARQMVAHGQSVFLLERMQPDWLPGRWQQRLAIWGAAILGGLVGALVFGLVGGLVGELAVGLAFGLVFGLVGGLVVGLGQGAIEPAETLRWSWPAAHSALVGWLVVGSIIGLVGGLVGGLVFGLVFALVFGLVGGLIGGLNAGEMPRQDTANAGMRRSAHVALISALVSVPVATLVFGLVSGLVGGLVEPKVVYLTFVLEGRLVEWLAAYLGAWLVMGLYLGLFVGLAVGLVVGLEKGGAACLQHLVLRYLLVRNGLAPWKYATFLDHATERFLLRKVGGGYIFIHRLLQDYLAELWEREYGLSE
ncbi:MAG: NACHT domain-containing protein [Anaerolineae bacterium]|nr:NACHT domain-containing protein [Anaerolineae bacterium]